MKFPARILLPAFLLAAIFTVLLEVEPFSAGHHTMESLLFQVEWQPSTGGVARLYYDDGGGFLRAKSVIANVTANTRQRSRFLLPSGRMNDFRLELPDHGGHAEVFAARITDLTENELVPFDPTQFWADEKTDGVEFKQNSAVITNAASLSPEAPVDVFASPNLDRKEAVFSFACAFLLASILLWKLETRVKSVGVRLSRLTQRLIFKARASPRLTLALAAGIAVLVSCHPIIFFGKSFVSPNNRAICLYDDFPTVPGGPAGPIEDPKASDIGAMLWSHLPYSMMEHEAIFHDGELPLWNRWNYGGIPLLAQGQSMIGDPLHWIAICANGAPWAWDLKFVLARFVFSFGVGLLVLAAVERLGIAALLAGSSAFIGFYSYRFNHAACFSLAYAPWILFAWLKIARAAGWRSAGRWALLLAAANWVELNSGTAKESAMLIVGMNFSGVLVLLFGRETAAARLRKAGLAAAGLLLFLLLSAPCWLLFLDTLRHAYSTYETPRAYQIQPSLFLGLFDDMFYRETTRSEMHTNPASNFLVLIGILWAVAASRRLASDRMFLGLGLSALPPLAMVFGIVPPGFIVRLPFLGNVSHIDNTFSCVLIVLFFPIAGFGFRECRARMTSPQWLDDCGTALLLCAALAFAYFGFSQAVTRSGLALLQQAEPMPKTPFFIGYSAALFLSFVCLPRAARSLFLSQPGALSNTLICALALIALHFRMGMYLETKFDPYVMNPQERVNLHAPSPAVEYVKSHLPEPARVTGFGGVLTTGFNPVIGLESPGGSDPLLNSYIRELIQSMGLKLLWDWRLTVEKDTTAMLRPFYDFLGVRYYLGAPATPADQIAGLRLAGSRDLDVYESPTVWPRAFYTDSASYYQKPSEFPRIVWEADHRPFAAWQTGLGEEEFPLLPTSFANRRAISAKDYRVTSNSIAFTLDAPAAGIAVLCEGFEEGNFRATVNGRPSAYFRINQAFKGVFLPQAGRYSIRFSYWPRLLTPALCLSALGAALLAGALGLVFPVRSHLKKASVTA